MSGGGTGVSGGGTGVSGGGTGVSGGRGVLVGGTGTGVEVGGVLPGTLVAVAASVGDVSGGGVTPVASAVGLPAGTVLSAVPVAGLVAVEVGTRVALGNTARRVGVSVGAARFGAPATWDKGQRAVRVWLREQGLDIPEDCWFLGAEHNTCSEAILWYDLDRLPVTKAGDFQRLEISLGRAVRLHAQERCRKFFSAPAQPTPDQALAHVLGKFTGGRHRRYLLHWAYWHLPFGSGFTRTPPSHLREFIG